MKIAMCCPTYKRPKLLGRMIHCFLQQTHPDFKLFVLDDAGQYESKDYGKWEMISVKTRFKNLAVKRSFFLELLDSSFDGYSSCDDDDCYWPHAVEYISMALETAPWAQCRYVFESVDDKLSVVPAFGSRPGDWGYGGCWNFRLDEMRRFGGFQDIHGPSEDLRLATIFHGMYGESADSTPAINPWYWYNREPGLLHSSDEGQNFYEMRGDYPAEERPELVIGWNGPNLYEREVLPGIGKRPW